MKNTKINKMAMNSEEQAIINNISALLTELQMIGGQNEPGAEVGAPIDMGMGAMKQQEETARPPEKEDEIQKQEMEDDEEVKKEIVDNDDDSSTASDPAGERDEEVNITEETVDEIAKAIYAMAKQKKKQKAAVNNTSIIPVLQELGKTMKSINNRQEETEKVISSILEGIGVAKAIEQESGNLTKVEKNKPVRSNNDMESMLKHIVSELGEQKLINKDVGSQTDKARTILKSFLPTFIQGEK